MKRYTLYVMAYIFALFLYTQCASYAVTGAKVYANKGQGDEAIVVLEERIKEKPDDFASAYMLGYFYQNKYPGTGDLNNFALIHQNKVFLDKMMNYYSLSRKYSSKYDIGIENNLKVAYSNVYNLGSADLKKGTNEPDSLKNMVLYQAAYEEFTYAVKIKEQTRGLEQDNRALEGMAVTLSAMGKEDEAITIFKQLLEKDPKNMNSLLQMGSTNFNLAEKVKADTVAASSYYKTAINYWEKLVEYYPEKISDRAPELAWCYERLNQYGKAIEYYQKALVKKPNDRGLLLSIGQVKFNMGDIDGALVIFKQLIEKNPNDKQLYPLIAFPLWDRMVVKRNAQEEITRGEIDLLLPYMVKVVEFDSNSVVGHQSLAYMYAQLDVRYNVPGAGEKAKFHYARYIELITKKEE